MTDPKVVLQAHALRTRRTSAALLHGTARPRRATHLSGAVIGSFALAALIVAVVTVVARIVSVLAAVH
jgi:hypothetical protein